MNPLPFDPVTWPEYEKKGWRLGIGEDQAVRRYLGMTALQVAFVDAQGHIAAAHIFDCLMLPPVKKIEFRVALLKSGDTHWLKIFYDPSVDLSNDAKFVRWPTPDEMHDGFIFTEGDS